MRRALASGLALASIAACDDFKRLALLKPRALTVSVRDHHITSADAGSFFVLPPGGPAIEAWVYAGGAEWQHVDGTWVDAGVCELIAPSGFTWLSRPDAPGFFEAEGNDVDFGGQFTGLPYRLASESSTVTFDVEGAAAVNERTVSVAWISETLEQESNLRGLGLGVRPVGITSPTRYSFRADWKDRPLFTAKPVTVFQGRELAGGYVLAKSGTVTVTPADGRDVQPPRVTLADLATAATAVPPFVIDPAGWPAQVKDAVPFGSVDVLTAEVQAYYEWGRGALPVQAVVGSGSTPLTLPELTVDPLPGTGWTPRISVSLDFTSTIQFEGDDAGIPVPLSASFSAPVSDFAFNASTWPLPVNDIRADGKTKGELATLTPVLTWTKSTPANRYRVEPIRLTKTDIEPGPTLRVFSERCPIPPGILEAKSQYLFLVVAENCGFASASSPLRRVDQPRCSFVWARSYLFDTP